MKIRPIEKNDKKTVKIKLLLLLILIIVGFFIPVFIKKPTEENLKKNGEVFGEAISITPIINFKELEKQGNQLKEQILGETAAFVSQTASSAGNTVSSFIYDSTIKPIMDQIQKLPKNQQEKVKKQICK